MRYVRNRRQKCEPRKQGIVSLVWKSSYSRSSRGLKTMRREQAVQCRLGRVGWVSATKITWVEENITALCNEERPMERSERDRKGDLTRANGRKYLKRLARGENRTSDRACISRGAYVGTAVCLDSGIACVTLFKKIYIWIAKLGRTRAHEIREMRAQNTQFYEKKMYVLYILINSNGGWKKIIRDDTQHFIFILIH